MRRFMLNVVTALLVLVVSGGVFSFALKDTLNANKAKQALAQSGTYAAVAPSIIQQYGSEQVAGVSIASPIVKEAAIQAFPEQYVQTKLEPAIDDTFTWLQGSKARPDFVIDYSSAKQQFIGLLSTNTARQLNNLPSCTLADIIRLGTSGLGSLSTASGLTCLPSGVTQSQLEQLIKTYLATSPNQPELLKRTSYQASDITLDGQPFYETASASYLKNSYQLLDKAPFISIVAALVLLGVIYWLSRSRRKTLIRLAIVLILAGLLVAIAAFSVKPLAHHALSAATNNSDASRVLEQRLSSAGTILVGDTARYLRISGALLIIAGSMPLIVLQWRSVNQSSPRRK